MRPEWRREWPHTARWDRVPGLLVCAVLAAAAWGLQTLPFLGGAGVGVLTVALLLGLLLGHAAPSSWHRRATPGAVLAQRQLLRLGVGLYGLRLTAAQIAAVGVRGVLIDVLVIVSTLALAVCLGMRWLRLDRETALLVGTGSAICGAAAVLAAEPVLRASPHKVAFAVGTVTLFGTLATFLYPLLYHLFAVWAPAVPPLAGLQTPAAFGVYIGSTVHEVAQVVVAARAVSPAAADQAVVVKLIRVALLAPALLLLARWAAPVDAAQNLRRAPVLPWFVGLFIAAAVLNSLHWIPPTVHAVLMLADSVLLTLAMAALGWCTRWQAVRAAGWRPLLLGALLFVHLLVGGYVINRLVDGLSA